MDLHLPTRRSEPIRHSAAVAAAQDWACEIEARAGIAAQELPGTRIAFRESDLVVDVVDVHMQCDGAVHVISECGAEDAVAGELHAIRRIGVTITIVLDGEL